MERATVERAMAGDHDAFARLASASIRSMFATARLIVRNDAAAEDATQEALMNAWRHLPSLRDPDRFEAWLYRLLVNACRTQLRKPGSHDVVEIEVVDADQRAVLILPLYRGYTGPEVAEMVGIPVGTAKSRIHRATNVLRAALEADARPIIAIEASRP